MTGNGVVHVGAHLGEEVQAYRLEGRSPIILFEPQDLSGDRSYGTYWVPFALGDRQDILQLRCPLHYEGEPKSFDTQSATGLTIIRERAEAIGWKVTKTETIAVEMTTFDAWARGLGFAFGWRNNPCSLLVIDVQGMEMQVLVGFGKWLDGFKEIKVECSHPAIYAGGYDAIEVVNFLEKRGFTQESPILPHGDVHFIKGLK